MKKRLFIISNIISITSIMLLFTNCLFSIESTNKNESNGLELNKEDKVSSPLITVSGSIVINELLASNKTIIADPQGEYDDWIELYNNSGNSINLSGKYLTDKFDNLIKWQFPDNTIIGSGEYLIVWADENGSDTPGLHTNFKLSASGEIVLLVDSDGHTIIDSISFGEQTEDVSFGRYPNATGSFTYMKPSPGAYNTIDGTSVADNNENQLNTFEVYPNPFNNNINISIHVATKGYYFIEIYDIKGNLIKSIANNYLEIGSYNFQWNGTNEDNNKVSSNNYILMINDGRNIITKSITLIN